MSTFSLTKSSGLPLETQDNPDGKTSLLKVGATLDALYTGQPRIPGKYANNDTTPGVEQTLLEYTVPAGETHYVTTLFVSCRVEGVAVLRINGDAIASQRTSAASPNISLNLYPASEVASTGDTVDVLFTARLNSAVTSVECKLSGFTQTTS